jgi:hypothetical protein
MQPTGCFPAAFVVLALLSMLGFSELQRQVLEGRFELNLSHAALIAIPLMFLAAGVLLVARLRRWRQGLSDAINRP